VNDCTVLYLALESGDTLSGAGEALRAALERRGRLVSPKIVLHSFNHLTGHAMAVAQAQDLYEKLPVFLESHGSAAAVLTEFGWIYEICLHDIGQRGSKGRIVTQGGTENEKG
jgi:hypothetical protein